MIDCNVLVGQHKLRNALQAIHFFPIDCPHIEERSECACVSSVIDAFRYGAGGRRWRQAAGHRVPEPNAPRPVCVPNPRGIDAYRAPSQLARETRSADSHKSEYFTLPATFVN